MAKDLSPALSGYFRFLAANHFGCTDAVLRGIMNYISTSMSLYGHREKQARRMLPF
jgi:hypothetical protein